MFEMGANFEDGWSADNHAKMKSSQEIKAYDKHQLIFAKEKRKGKTVTIVKPFYLEKKELQSLLKTLKKKLATGGSIKEESLEFQGEVKEVLTKELKSLGFKIKA
ncbi:MAG TPA: translation initiation factor [Campylobacterales bacterium]|nr:translation initiation factor [Campylobacterales bacterium]